MTRRNEKSRLNEGEHPLTPDKEPPSVAELEKAVHALLKPPHVEYLKEIDEGTQEDPNYLFNHEFSVGMTIQRILSSEGVRWKPDMMRQHWPRALRLALHKISERK